ncbi:Flp family type IVb pilin [Hoeflea sp. G2-23]|uniref:Flp family type IVb pilin n=1 Tax=Hoeflea algicola TaxID=2983763 RepID=A0ABT3ZA55_9HYPH|nr:Flp family type IVb pilin [Hoeflea algicola]MCY0148660.1 Flp family type IVb pilin [Hoeflea algicola]
MKTVMTWFLKDKSGATAIEYGLIAGFLSIALVVGASTLGNTINNTFDGAAQHLVNSQ